MLLENEQKCLSPEPNFIYDEACVDVSNLLDNEVSIWGQYSECDGCAFREYITLLPNGTTSLLINTKYSIQMHFKYANKVYCSWTDELLEHYRYGWNVTTECSPKYIKEHDESAYLPILSTFIILFVFGTLWYMVKGIYKCSRGCSCCSIWRRCFTFADLEIQNENYNVQTVENTSLLFRRKSATPKHPDRVKSIDVFRGLCVIIMIFVNYGGGQYWFFQHAVWNGLTVADLVFPWFLWIMGLSYNVALTRMCSRGSTRTQLLLKVVKRSAILMLLGIILNSHSSNLDLKMLRFPGVLQHIGVVYLIVGVIESPFFKRTLTVQKHGTLNCLQDIIIAWPQWLVTIVLVALHTYLILWFDVPGCGKGYLGPGGLHDRGKYFNCTGGAAGYIDRLVFGEHMNKESTFKQVYETRVYFDQGGILGTFSSVFLTYLGIQAGRILNSYTSTKARVKRWVAWGLVTGLAGCALSNFSKNGGVIPINKNLWSLSFVLVLGGMAFLIQAYLFVVVDVKEKWGGRPLFYPGMNSIVLYIGHFLLRNTFPFAWAPTVKSHASYLAMHLWGTAIWVAISIFMYTKNIFVHI